MSQPGGVTKDWHRVRIPTTVLNALVKAGVYPDRRVGLNSYQIPDSSDEFNAAHDLARFSHLPGQRNPWRDPFVATDLPLPETNQAALAISAELVNATEATVKGVLRVHGEFAIGGR